MTPTTKPDRQAAIAALGDDRPLSKPEAAATLGVGPATLDRYIARGYLRKTKVAGRSFVLLGEVRRLLREGTGAPPAPTAPTAPVQPAITPNRGRPRKCVRAPVGDAQALAASLA